MVDEDRANELDEGEATSVPVEEGSGGEERGIAVAVEQVEHFVESDSGGLLERVLDRHLSVPLTEQAFQVVRDAGMLVMGEDGFGLIVWVSSKPDRAKAVEMLNLSPKARSWFTGVIALYGDRINEALHKSDVLASRRDDWEGFGRRVLVDPSSGEYEITTEIQKFSGEKLVIKAGLPSAVRLAERALATLVAVGDLGSIEDEDREDLLQAMDAVREKFGTPPSEASS